MSVKIALCMIIKSSNEEAQHLYTCLENVKPHVNQVFLNINTEPGKKPNARLLQVAKEFKAKYIVTEWHDNFAEARNANMAQVPKDFTHILWLDADDTVDNPEKIRRVAELSENFDAIYVNYLYEQDEDSNPVTVHMVARLFKNNGAHAWKGRIHETLIETRSVAQGATKDFTVVHHADGIRRNHSLERNIRILQLQLEDESDDPDPRTLYYLGSTYIDAGQAEAAKSLLLKYLTLSGWDQERSVAHTKLGRLYLEENNHAEAKKHFMLAIGENPDDPSPRVEMGSLELELKQLHKARKWLEGVESMDKPMTTLERNPMSYTFRTYLLLADVYLGLGGPYLDKALEYAKKALKYKKRDKNIKKYVKVIDSVVQDKHLTEKVLDIVKILKKNKEETKIKSLVDSLPRQLDDNPIVVQLRNDGEPFKWPEKSVVIMCGDTAIDPWGPWSLAEGIGGSEEAVIRLSKHLKELGYRVVVYAKPSERSGEYDGVMWRNFWEANLDDEFDIFVAWRSPYIFDREIEARKNYLWLHDVMEPGEFTKERLANLTKVIVLSKYHRSLYKMIPDEKIMLSGNGIDPSDFAAYDGLLERDPHRIFYGSSHVRGLSYLYHIWPDVRKAVPDALLEVFYGRNSYDSINAGNPERLRWMDEMEAKAKELDGVTDHGKVGQNQIIIEQFKSGIWAYPTSFPEIYCITAIKVQASGCVPVTSDYAALDETVQFGYKQKFTEFDEADLEKYKKKLIWWLQHPAEQEKLRRKMEKWARQHSWLKVAKEWDAEFRG